MEACEWGRDEQLGEGFELLPVTIAPKDLPSNFNDSFLSACRHNKPQLAAAQVICRWLISTASDQFFLPQALGMGCEVFL